MSICHWELRSGKAGKPALGDGISWLLPAEDQLLPHPWCVGLSTGPSSAGRRYHHLRLKPVFSPSKRFEFCLVINPSPPPVPSQHFELMCLQHYYLIIPRLCLSGCHCPVSAGVFTSLRKPCAMHFFFEIT